MLRAVASLPGLAGAPIDTSFTATQVATNCTQCIATAPTLRQTMSRKQHQATERLKRPQIVFPNYYIVSGVEAGPSGQVTISASIEYPAGTFTRITFGGQQTGIIEDKAYLVSDAVGVDIPSGATFWTRHHRTGPNGIVYTGATLGVNPTITGEGWVQSTTTTPDLTMGGAVTQAAANIYGPVAIVGPSQRRGFALFGDSLQYGATDTPDPFTGHVGMASRAISPMFGVMNLGSTSDQAVVFLNAANRPNSRALAAAYATDIHWQYGTNDIGTTGTRTAPQVLADLASCVATFPTKRHYMSTLPPRTTSTDGWTTTVNQAVIALIESIRVAVNTGIRGPVAGVIECTDIARYLETSVNSGIFNIEANSGTSNITTDGVHVLANGAKLVSRSPAFWRALFNFHN